MLFVDLNAVPRPLHQSFESKEDRTLLLFFTEMSKRICLFYFDRAGCQYHIFYFTIIVLYDKKNYLLNVSILVFG